MSRSTNGRVGYLARVLGGRAFLAFGFVSLLTVFLLAAVNVSSRYAMQQYVEDQVRRIPWDISIYQTAEVPLAERVHETIAGDGRIVETRMMVFLRTILPPQIQPVIDGQPLRTPWMSVLTASDPSLVPPDIRPSGDDAVFVLVGSKASMGNAYLHLQGRKNFELRVDLKGGHAGGHGHIDAASPDDGRGKASPAHDHAGHGHHEGHDTDADHPPPTAKWDGIRMMQTRLERTIRIDGNELNRWFLEHTSSPTLVPELGVILVVPFKREAMLDYDALSRGLAHDDAHDDIHVSTGEYFADVIHLARVDRSRMITGWDVESSLQRLEAVGEAIRTRAKKVSYAAAVDNTAAAMFSRMAEIARRIGLITLLVSLPLLGMAWILLANLSGLFLLNERRKLGLLRLRGVPGSLIARSLMLAIGLGGVIGGLAGAALGTALPVIYYAGGWLPWDVLLRVQPPHFLLIFVIVGVAMALLVSRRLVRYASTITPLEASGRIAGSEAVSGGVRFGPFQAAALVVGGAKAIAWIGGWRLATLWPGPWVGETDRALDFVAFPLFVYGLVSLVASHERLMSIVLAPVVWLVNPRLRDLTLRHMETRRHRLAGFLMIVGLMSSLALYPTVMTAVFDDKTTRGAMVQLGADLQVTLNTLDLIPAAAQERGSLEQRFGSLNEALTPVLARLRNRPEVSKVAVLAEGLVDGLYMPDRGFSGVPIYLIGNTKSYLDSVYHEPELGKTGAFVPVMARLDRGDVLVSDSIHRFYKRPVGTAMPVGRNVAGRIERVGLGGAVYFVPGMPLKTVNDREGFVSARVDYLNYLFGQSPYLLSGDDFPALQRLDVLIPRVVVAVRRAPGVSAAALRSAALAAIGVKPLEVRELDTEIARLASDMYIFLARQNVRIYLLGGMVLAIIGLLAVAYSNYLEDRRTLALLRIRGGGPGVVLRFFAPGILAPSVAGLVIGGLVALIVGYGITRVIWELRELQTILSYLAARLALSSESFVVVAILVLVILGIALFFGRWVVFRRTLQRGLSDG